jgi:hypothetical protein
MAILGKSNEFCIEWAAVVIVGALLKLHFN